MNIIRKAAAAVMVISLLTSFYLNYFRFQAEGNYKSVGIYIDYDELSALARANQVSLEDMARRFKEAGVTGVLVRERILKDLEQYGSIIILTAGSLTLQQEMNKNIFPGFNPVPGNTYILLDNQVDYDYLYRQLAVAKKGVSGLKHGELFLISAPLSQKDLERMGVGFPPRELERIHKGGLAIIPRIRESAKSSVEGMDLLVQTLQDIPGLSLVAFNDAAIPGATYDNIRYLGQRLADQGIPVGTFEFFPQQGLVNLAYLLDKNVVRVHAIAENELGRYNEPQAVERFRLAVAERNIRALYIRFFGLDQSIQALDRALDYVNLLKTDLEREGFTVGPPSLLAGVPYSVLPMFIVGLGVIAAAVFVLSFLTTTRWTLVWSILALAGWAGALLISPLLARKAMALASVIIFPVIGVIAFVRQEGRGLKEATGTLLLMSAVSFAGAVLMTGLLAEKSFMLALDGFTGVKLAHAVPLALIPAYFYFRGRNPVARAKEFLNTSLYTKHALAAAVLLLVLAVYLVRTGNDAPMLVSAWELKIRSVLDQLLGVRPRTKEFLLGHPAMLLSLYYGVKIDDLKKFGLLVFGIIGQVSLVNTYAHIHTPLAVSLLRSFHGLWLGIVLGVVAVWVLNTGWRWLAKEGVR